MGGGADPQSRRNTNRGGSGADIKICTIYIYLITYFALYVNRWLEGKKR